MVERFSDLLEEYLDERDRLASDYYDRNMFQQRSEGVRRLAELGRMMDDMIYKIE